MTITYAHHKPGEPLEDPADGKSSRAYERELAKAAVDTKANEHVVEYTGIDTRTPEANLASRSNIVRDAE